MENGTRDRRSTFVVFMCTVTAYGFIQRRVFEWNGNFFVPKWRSEYIYFFPLFSLRRRSRRRRRRRFQIYFIRAGWGGFDIFSGCAAAVFTLNTLYVGECQVVWVVMVIKGKYTVVSPLFSIRYTTTAKTRYKKKCKRRRREAENRICAAERENRLYTVYSPPSSSSTTSFDFIPFYSRSTEKCVSKVVWLSNWHTWISGTPKNVQRNEKRFVTFFEG